MRKLFYNILILILLPVILPAQEYLSLERCREMALQKDEELKIAEIAIEKADAEKAATRSNYLPSLSGSATGIYLKDDIEEEMYFPTAVPGMTKGEMTPNIMVDNADQPVIGADGNPVFNMYAWMPLEISLKGAYLAGISIEQPLFTGGRILAGNKMAAIGVEMARENMELQRMNTLAEADQTYWLYVSVKEKVKLAEQSVDMLSRLLQHVENSYEEGMVKQNEVMKVRVQYNKARLDLQKAQSGLDLTRMSLCRITGLPFNTQIIVTDTIIDCSGEFISQTGGEDVTSRPEYKMMEKNIAMEEQKIKMARAEYLPVIGLSAGYNYIGGIELGGSEYNQGNMTVIASLKIPIFNWGEGINKISLAKADKEINQLKLNKNRQLLQLEIEQGRQNLENAWLRISIAESALKQAGENLRISKDHYDLGIELMTDMLIAQVEWQKAYSEVIEAKTDYKLRETEYLKATAGLLSVSP